MTLTYLICLIAGALLVCLSLSEGESDGGIDAIGTGGVVTVLFSTPFWSFGLCGFGLSGLLMTLLRSNQTGISTVFVALVVGLSMGWAAARILRLMGRRDVDSLVRNDELVGLEGRVTLAVSNDERGFVELMARGSLLRRPARSISGTLEDGTTVVVIASDEHTLQVERLETGSKTD